MASPSTEQRGTKQAVTARVSDMFWFGARIPPSKVASFFVLRISLSEKEEIVRIEEVLEMMVFYVPGCVFVVVMVDMVVMVKEEKEEEEKQKEEDDGEGEKEKLDEQEGEKEE
ncbi:hypothetical protein ACROYT_G009172 [Oculina patagonica]